jgi:hypothetical protein
VRRFQVGEGPKTTHLIAAQIRPASESHKRGN